MVATRYHLDGGAPQTHRGHGDLDRRVRTGWSNTSNPDTGRLRTLGQLRTPGRLAPGRWDGCRDAGAGLAPDAGAVPRTAGAEAEAKPGLPPLASW